MAIPVVALIEDDPLFRIPLAYGLNDAGFSVVSAAGGAEGLALLRDAKVDVAVVDIRLPGRIDGLDVIRQTRAHNPGLKAILISGVDPAPDVSDLGPFLRKPFRARELVEAVRQLLADKRGL